MEKKLNVIAAFFIMLCLGSIYSWSIFVPELNSIYGLSTSQTQLIFGTVIAVFPLTMIWAAKLNKRLGPCVVTTFSGILFALGYIVAFLSKGNFFFLWFGIGILGGIGTGMGYLVSLIVPIKWFPNKKGLVTGIIAAGFGLGAVILSYAGELLLKLHLDVLKIFLFAGLIYGFVIIFLAKNIREPDGSTTDGNVTSISFRKWVVYFQLILGIFAGTFTGLLVIGNLKPIALTLNINESAITFTIALFAFANFLGRIVWGWLSDIYSTVFLIPVALVLQGVAAIGLVYFKSTEILFVLLIFIVGFCFGASFVLFAKETIHRFGLARYDKVYPYIFLGYAFAGIVGPLVGGLVFDAYGSYFLALTLALVLSLIAAIVYILLSIKIILNRKK